MVSGRTTAPTPGIEFWDIKKKTCSGKSLRKSAMSPVPWMKQRNLAIGYSFTANTAE
jgi:hypothetical protein